MLTFLPEPAATVVAMAAFTGARKGEIRGFLWQNYDGHTIEVKHEAQRGPDSPVTFRTTESSHLLKPRLLGGQSPMLLRVT